MTGKQSKPWHPDRKHYRCSRRENLTVVKTIIMNGRRQSTVGDDQDVGLMTGVAVLFPKLSGWRMT